MNVSILKKLLLSACILLFCSGCSLAYGDGLLALPKLPGEYVQLQKQLDKVLEGGASYAVAETGANRQAVQLADLDADGVDEAIAFFRTADGMYQIYVFRQTDDGYAEVGMIEAYANTLHSIYYPRYNVEGRLMLIVCWGAEDTSGYGMTALTMEASGLRTVLDLNYADMLVQDLDNDRVDELCFAVRDAVTGLYSARIYRWSGEKYEQLLDVSMCLEVKSVANMAYGMTLGDRYALFIDSQSISGGYVTDIISYDGRTAANETIDPASGSGSATWRPISVFSADINDDGVLDVPVGRTGSDEQRSRLQWYDFRGGVEESMVASTYHCPTEAWYFVWPGAWGDVVQTTKISSPNLFKTTFSVGIPTSSDPQSNEEKDDRRTQLLSIWVFTGDNREEHRQLYPNLKLLKTTSTAIYCYSLNESDFPNYALTDAQITSLFHTIEANWLSEVY
ncbi:MAG: hypothetical protein VB086_02485 [Clostridiaceae bacterium]|nr:hypothetical protein [Clostridiaceae bacterium]